MRTPGPAPDPNALRRQRPSDKATWKPLPATGLPLAPDWPEEIEEPPTVRDLALWNRLWTTYPQAHVWQHQHSEMQVAVYVRTALAASWPAAAPPVLANFRQLSDMLLLTDQSLAKARYRIERDQTPLALVDADGRPAAPVTQLRTLPSARDRMRAHPAEADDEDEIE